jgi:hypothetical protein
MLNGLIDTSVTVIISNYRLEIVSLGMIITSKMPQFPEIITQLTGVIGLILGVLTCFKIILDIKNRLNKK